ncbi:DUF2087 domain-containing protein [Phenylobacterium sp.]|uniref:DUF2087 domain-containing protein n=1 Tax=Phenylobacterium sp. TaxID=1871053 RepID=UPI0025FD040A|nr:DUF2087 domain-containing protein [Phenylobacterium sp.]MCA3745209.1 DUF2087 domain-containing protein [Phenylobacterium sp.]
MPRTFLPFAVDDISALARSLRLQLAARTGTPGHVEMLNMLARAAGARNFQQLRAQTASSPAPSAPEPEPDLALVERTARRFDAEGRLASWPAKTSLQSLALWGLWSRIPAETVFSEVGFNQRLNAISQIGDPALLRRSMVHAGLVSRTDDCRDYRRIERGPPPDARALIRRLGPG